MASEAGSPESTPITRNVDEDKWPSRQLHGSAEEFHTKDTTIKISSSAAEAKQVKIHLPEGQETSLLKGNDGTSDGECFSKAPNIEKVAYENTDLLSEDCLDAAISNQAESGTKDNRSQQQKYNFEGAEDMKEEVIEQLKQAVANQEVEITPYQHASGEINKQDTEEAANGMQKKEEESTKTDKDDDEGPHSEVPASLEDQRKDAPDSAASEVIKSLTMDVGSALNASYQKEHIESTVGTHLTALQVQHEGTSFKENLEASFTSAAEEGPGVKAIKEGDKLVSEKDRGQIPYHGLTDVSISTMPTSHTLNGEEMIFETEVIKNESNSSSALEITADKTSSEKIKEVVKEEETPCPSLAEKYHNKFEAGGKVIDEIPNVEEKNLKDTAVAQAEGDVVERLDKDDLPYLLSKMELETIVKENTSAEDKEGEILEKSGGNHQKLEETAVEDDNPGPDPWIFLSRKKEDLQKDSDMSLRQASPGKRNVIVRSMDYNIIQEELTDTEEQIEKSTKEHEALNSHCQTVEIHEPEEIDVASSRECTEQAAIAQEASVTELVEESLEETREAGEPIGTDYTNPHGTLCQNEFVETDSNEETRSTESDIRNKITNGLSIAATSTDQTTEAEDEKKDAVFKFEPQEQKTNEVSSDEQAEGATQVQHGGTSFTENLEASFTSVAQEGSEAKAIEEGDKLVSEKDKGEAIPDHGLTDVSVPTMPTLHILNVEEMILETDVSSEEQKANEVSSKEQAEGALQVQHGGTSFTENLEASFTSAAEKGPEAKAIEEGDKLVNEKDKGEAIPYHSPRDVSISTMPTSHALNVEDMILETQVSSEEQEANEVSPEEQAERALQVQHGGTSCNENIEPTFTPAAEEGPEAKAIEEGDNLASEKDRGEVIPYHGLTDVSISTMPASHSLNIEEMILETEVIMNERNNSSTPEIAADKTRSQKIKEEEPRCPSFAEEYQNKFETGGKVTDQIQNVEEKNIEDAAVAQAEGDVEERLDKDDLPYLLSKMEPETTVKENTSAEDKEGKILEESGSVHQNLEETAVEDDNPGPNPWISLSRKKEDLQDSDMSLKQASPEKGNATVRSMEYNIIQEHTGAEEQIEKSTKEHEALNSLCQTVEIHEPEEIDVAASRECIEQAAIACAAPVTELVEESLEETRKAGEPIGTDNTNSHGTLGQNKFLEADSNEKTRSTESDIRNKITNNLSTAATSSDQTTEAEGEKKDVVSKFEPQEQKGNEVSSEEQAEGALQVQHGGTSFSENLEPSFTSAAEEGPKPKAIEEGDKLESEKDKGEAIPYHDLTDVSISTMPTSHILNSEEMILENEVIGNERNSSSTPEIATDKTSSEKIKKVVKEKEPPCPPFAEECQNKFETVGKVNNEIPKVKEKNLEDDAVAQAEGDVVDRLDKDDLQNLLSKMEPETTVKENTSAEDKEGEILEESGDIHENLEETAVEDENPGPNSWISLSRKKVDLQEDIDVSLKQASADQGSVSVRSMDYNIIQEEHPGDEEQIEKSGKGHEALDSHCQTDKIHEPEVKDVAASRECTEQAAIAQEATVTELVEEGSEETPLAGEPIGTDYTNPHGTLGQNADSNEKTRSTESDITNKITNGSSIAATSTDQTSEGEKQDVVSEFELQEQKVNEVSSKEQAEGALQVQYGETRFAEKLEASFTSAAEEGPEAKAIEEGDKLVCEKDKGKAIPYHGLTDVSISATTTSHPLNREEVILETEVIGNERNSSSTPMETAADKTSTEKNKEVVKEEEPPRPSFAEEYQDKFETGEKVTNEMPNVEEKYLKNAAVAQEEGDEAERVVKDNVLSKMEPETTVKENTSAEDKAGEVLEESGSIHENLEETAVEDDNPGPNPSIPLSRKKVDLQEDVDMSLKQASADQRSVSVRSMDYNITQEEHTGAEEQIEKSTKEHEALGSHCQTDKIHELEEIDVAASRECTEQAAIAREAPATKLVEEGSEETRKASEPLGTDYTNRHGTLGQNELVEADSNENTTSTEADVTNITTNGLSIAATSTDQTTEADGEKQDAVSKVEPQALKVNEVSMEEQAEGESEVNKSTGFECTERKPHEEAAATVVSSTSHIEDNQTNIYCPEPKKSQEVMSTEDIVDTGMRAKKMSPVDLQEVPLARNAEKGTVEDVPLTVSILECTANETIKESLEAVSPNGTEQDICGEDKSHYIDDNESKERYTNQEEENGDKIIQEKHTDDQAMVYLPQEQIAGNVTESSREDNKTKGEKFEMKDNKAQDNKDGHVTDLAPKCIQGKTAKPSSDKDATESTKKEPHKPEIVSVVESHVKPQDYSNDDSIDTSILQYDASSKGDYTNLDPQQLQIDKNITEDANSGPVSEVESLTKSSQDDERTEVISEKGAPEDRPAEDLTIENEMGEATVSTKNKQQIGQAQKEENIQTYLETTKELKEEEKLVQNDDCHENKISEEVRMELNVDGTSMGVEASRPHSYAEKENSNNIEEAVETKEATFEAEHRHHADKASNTTADCVCTEENRESNNPVEEPECGSSTASAADIQSETNKAESEQRSCGMLDHCAKSAEEPITEERQGEDRSLTAEATETNFEPEYPTDNAQESNQVLKETELNGVKIIQEESTKEQNDPEKFNLATGDKTNHKENSFKEQEASITEKTSPEGESQKAKDVARQVCEIPEQITKEQIIEGPDINNHALDNTSNTVEIEESLQEVQQQANSTQDHDVNSNHNSQETSDKVEIALQGPEENGRNFEGTMEAVSNLPITECDNPEQEGVNVEDLPTNEVAEMHRVPGAECEPTDEAGRKNNENSSTKDLDTDDKTTHKESNETIPHTAISVNKGDQQSQQPSSVLFADEKESSTPTTIKDAEEENRTEVQVLIPNNIEGNSSGKTIKETCLQEEVPRQIEFSNLEAELCENLHNKAAEAEEVQKKDETSKLKEEISLEMPCTTAMEGEKSTELERPGPSCSKETQDDEKIEDSDSDNSGQNNDITSQTHSTGKQISDEHIGKASEGTSDTSCQKADFSEHIPELHEVITESEEITDNIPKEACKEMPIKQKDEQASFTTERSKIKDETVPTMDVKEKMQIENEEESVHSDSLLQLLSDNGKEILLGETQENRYKDQHMNPTLSTRSISESEDVEIQKEEETNEESQPTETNIEGTLKDEDTVNEGFGDNFESEKSNKEASVGVEKSAPHKLTDQEQDESIKIPDDSMHETVEAKEVAAAEMEHHNHENTASSSANDSLSAEKNPGSANPLDKLQDGFKAAVTYETLSETNKAESEGESGKMEQHDAESAKQQVTEETYRKENEERILTTQEPKTSGEDESSMNTGQDATQAYKEPEFYEKTEIIQEEITADEINCLKLPRVIVEDRTVHEATPVENPDSQSMLSYEETNSEKAKAKTSEVKESSNKEPETSAAASTSEERALPAEISQKPEDVICPFREPPEESTEVVIIEAEGNHDKKFNNASATMVTEVESLQEPQQQEISDKGYDVSSSEKDQHATDKMETASIREEKREPYEEISNSTFDQPVIESEIVSESITVENPAEYNVADMETLGVAVEAGDEAPQEKNVNERTEKPGSHDTVEENKLSNEQESDSIYQDADGTTKDKITTSKSPHLNKEEEESQQQYSGKDDSSRHMPQLLNEDPPESDNIYHDADATSKDKHATSQSPDSSQVNKAEEQSQQQFSVKDDVSEHMPELPNEDTPESEVTNIKKVHVEEASTRATTEDYPSQRPLAHHNVVESSSNHQAEEEEGIKDTNPHSPDEQTMSKSHQEADKYMSEDTNEASSTRMIEISGEEALQDSKIKDSTESIQELITEQANNAEKLHQAITSTETDLKVKSVAYIQNHDKSDADKLVETLSSEVVGSSKKEPEASTVARTMEGCATVEKESKGLQDVAKKVHEVPEESMTGDNMEASKNCNNEVDNKPLTTVPEEEILQVTQQQANSSNMFNVSSNGKDQQTNDQIEIAPNEEEVDSTNHKESPHRVSINASTECESTGKESRAAANQPPEKERMHGAVVPELGDETPREIDQNPTTEQLNSEDIIEGKTICHSSYQDVESIMEDNIAARETLPSNTTEEQPQHPTSESVPDKKESSAATIIKVTEEETSNKVQVIKEEVTDESFAKEIIEGTSLQEGMRDIEVSNLGSESSENLQPREVLSEEVNSIDTIPTLEQGESSMQMPSENYPSGSEEISEANRIVGNFIQETKDDKKDQGSDSSGQKAEMSPQTPSVGEQISQDNVGRKCKQASDISHQRAEASEQIHELHDESNTGLEATNMKEVHLEEVSKMPTTEEYECLENFESHIVKERGSSAEEVEGEEVIKDSEHHIIAEENKRQSHQETENRTGEPEKPSSSPTMNDNPDEEVSKDSDITEEAIAEEVTEDKKINQPINQDRTVPKVKSPKDSNSGSIQNHEAADLEKQIGTMGLEVKESIHTEPEAPTATRTLSLKEESEMTYDATSTMYKALEEGIKEENTEAAEKDNTKMDNTSSTMATEEKSLQETQPQERMSCSFDSSSNKKDEPTMDKIEIPPGEEEVTSTNQEESSNSVLDDPSLECKIAGQESVIFETQATQEAPEKITEETCLKEVSRDVEDFNLNVELSEDSPSKEALMEELQSIYEQSTLYTEGILMSCTKSSSESEKNIDSDLQEENRGSSIVKHSNNSGHDIVCSPQNHPIDEEISVENSGNTCKENTHDNYQKIDVSKQITMLSDEFVTESEQTNIYKLHLEAANKKPTTEENKCEKTPEGTHVTANETSCDEVEGGDKFREESNQQSQNGETEKESHQEDNQIVEHKRKEGNIVLSTQMKEVLNDQVPDINEKNGSILDHQAITGDRTEEEMEINIIMKTESSEVKKSSQNKSEEASHANMSEGCLVLEEESQKPEDVTKAVSEVPEEGINEDVTGAADNCESKLDSKLMTLLSDKSMQRAEKQENSTKTIDDSSREKDQQTSEGTEIALIGKKVGVENLDQTTNPISAFPTTEYENAGEQSVEAENSDRHEAADMLVDEPKEDPHMGRTDENPTIQKLGSSEGVEQLGEMVCGTISPGGAASKKDETADAQTTLLKAQEHVRLDKQKMTAASEPEDVKGQHIQDEKAPTEHKDTLEVPQIPNTGGLKDTEIHSRVYRSEEAKLEEERQKLAVSSHIQDYLLTEKEDRLGSSATEDTEELLKSTSAKASDSLNQTNTCTDEAPETTSSSDSKGVSDSPSVLIVETSKITQLENLEMETEKMKYRSKEEGIDAGKDMKSISMPMVPTEISLCELQEKSVQVQEHPKAETLRLPGDVGQHTEKLEAYEVKLAEWSSQEASEVKEVADGCSQGSLDKETKRVNSHKKELKAEESPEEKTNETFEPTKNQSASKQITDSQEMDALVTMDEHNVNTNPSDTLATYAMDETAHHVRKDYAIEDDTKSVASIAAHETTKVPEEQKGDVLIDYSAADIIQENQRILLIESAHFASSRAEEKVFSQKATGRGMPEDGGTGSGDEKAQISVENLEMENLKSDATEVYSTILSKIEDEIQGSHELLPSSDMKDSSTGICQKEGTMGSTNVTDAIPDIKLPQEASLGYGQHNQAQLYPKEAIQIADPAREEVPEVVQQDPSEEILQKDEVENFRLKKQQNPECDGQKKTGSVGGEKVGVSESMGSTIILSSDLPKTSIAETNPVAISVKKEGELKASRDKMQTTEVETVEILKLDEEKEDEEEEEGDEHESEHPGTGALMKTEAPRKMDIKAPHKKSHNILSGIKHSISKVKKVITGKSSHQKTTSPKKENFK